MLNKILIGLFICLLLVNISIAKADVGIGLRETTEQVIFDSAFDLQEKCSLVGIYNPFDTDVTGIISVSNLQDFLHSIEPNEVFVKNETMPEQAVVVNICFRNPFIRQFLNFLFEINKTEFKGSVSVKANSVAVSGGGSTTGSIVKLPFAVIINKTILDYLIFSAIIIAPIITAIFIVKRLRRKPKVNFQTQPS